MASNDPQVPWSDEQWARVTQAVQKEAARSRVAASFLPLVGPLPPDTDFIKKGELKYGPTAAPPNPPSDWQTMEVDDKNTIILTTLQVRVQLRGAQVADPGMTSALEMFRRGANVLARLEDAIIFRGQIGPNQGPPSGAILNLPAIWKVTSGSKHDGLLDLATAAPKKLLKRVPAANPGRQLVQDVSTRIGELEHRGHYGPFAVVLGETLFGDVQDPTDNLVLPSDRVIPFLGGGPLLRSSTLPDDKGIILALGAAPFELVIATDVSVGFLQVTTDPVYIFRVHEKIALRVKEPGAIALLERLPPVPKPAKPNH